MICLFIWLFNHIHDCVRNTVSAKENLFGFDLFEEMQRIPVDWDFD